MNRNTPIAFALCILVFAAPSAYAQDSTFKLVHSKRATMTTMAATAFDKLTAGKLGEDGKSLEFSSETASLSVHTGPEADMLSFWVQGLRNPSIYVRPGATMQVTFANTDDDMLHDIRFGSSKPPFAVMPSEVNTAGSHMLKHKTEKSVFAEVLTIKAPTKPGSYTYFCGVEGHAKGGMYGVVVVR
jgi:plastocyanin